ncbi:HlyD family secretion protein [Roseomonas populi]|uniref:HlyD family secretion protein n=1 Tax=Roseomonas populi TaxID=3121582 RepID=A0ABT1XA96_9PROT|nr:HlyD family secretion protein [Roseomonas pecuniae]MCR0985042.1 HlyD family secretion protein [Roseomonas pecuniae]
MSEPPAPPSQAPAVTASRSWFAGILPNLLALVLAAALVVAVVARWDSWVSGRIRQWTNDAYLQSDVTPLSALVAAPISRVAVDDFQTVRAGDVLLELDGRVYAAQLAQAEAGVAAATASIANLQAQEMLQQANISAAEAAVAGATATNGRDRLEAARQRALLRSGIVGTEQHVEQANAARDLSDAQLAQAQAGLQAARRQLEVQRSQEAQLRANLHAAEAARDLARINLGYATVTAPVDGTVGRRRVYPGQYVGVGTQVISVVPTSGLYVIANLRETQVTRLRSGQPAEIRVDSFPGLLLRGHVADWSPGTGAQFALLPADNSTGNFTKVVQRIPVKIMLDGDAGIGGRLRAGMSVEVTIHTDAPAP